MVTVSTSTEPARGYHHGDLRNSLLDEGISLVESEGLDALTLREVARRVGVSPTAVYRHFPDKRALLAALAQTGLIRLGDAQKAAAIAAGGGRAGFTATGRAYVRFALDNPGLFRLAFTHAETVHPAAGSGDEASAMLRANALSLSHGDPDKARQLALRAWAVAHGLAMLMLDGRVPADQTVIDATIDAGTLFVTHGSSSDASP